MLSDFEIAGECVAPGTHKQVSISAVRLYTNTPMDLIVDVVHGRKPGPVLLVTAAIHGDELNGVEICRQLLQRKDVRRISGTLLIVPVVNTLGYIQQSRYLPDRRDLNRCFPGSRHGSVGGRLAYILRTQLLVRATHAIDLHTGAIHRTNLPQIRADLKNPVNLQMAEAFGAPVILDSKPLAGSFRACAQKEKVPLILYEAGEGLRLDAPSVKAGVQGVLRVMRSLDMLSSKTPIQLRPIVNPVQVSSSYWVRAAIDGMVVDRAPLGKRVAKDDLLVKLATPFNREIHEMRARSDGLIIGATQIPVLNEGEAVLHIAEFSKLGIAEDSVNMFHDRFNEENLD